MAASRRRGVVRALVLTLFVLGLSAACGIPDYRFPEGGGAGAGPAPMVPTCDTDRDCRGFSATQLCDVRAGLCVECLPQLEVTAERCGTGLYCGADNRCVVGCRAAADCANGLTCEPNTHLCSGCTSGDQCSLGTVCEDGACVPRCSNDAGCPNGFQCCEDACVNFATEPLHCGACGSACADGQACINGSCGPGDGCPPGRANCDGASKNSCEVDLANDPLHCGECGARCPSGELCRGGACTPLDCPPERADCDDNPATACETDLTSAANCALCTTRCSTENAEASCSERACRLTCDDGFADCDRNSHTGCEVDTRVGQLAETRSQTRHCGECGVTCSNEHGSTRCTNSVCQPICASGYQDCDQEPQDGCETNILSTVEDCGSCGASCELDHATPACDAGICKVSKCDVGFEDCDGDASNGCEADLSSPATCGDCKTKCSSNGGAASCEGARCAIRCNADRADCANGVLDGCEAYTRISTSHCGGCNRACTAPEGSSPACNDRTCGISTCTAPFASCSPGADDCMTDTRSDAAHCGGCGNACYYPNGTSRCRQGVCEPQSCDAQWADCNDAAADGCETPLGTTADCTSCDEACSNEHGTTSCGSQGCTPTCAVGWGDCDGIKQNGCETPLDSAEHCGACGTECSRNNATTSCATGECAVVGCTPGFDDCDDEALAKNGCETNVRTLTDCGGCGIPCGVSNATATCSTGVCSVSQCAPGFSDCNSSIPGCETAIGTNANCETCGDTCQTQDVHVTSNTCKAGTPVNSCSPACTSGWKSCDNKPSNGCETEITSPLNCGDCGVVCALPNTSQHQCVAGNCQVGTCQTGWDNCNPSHVDGCELPVSTDINNCGSCKNVCNGSNGTPSCNGGTCAIRCAAGFGNCNNSVADGCEHDVTDDPLNCGACGTECGAATPFCVNSACRASLNISVVATTAATAVDGADLRRNHLLRNPAGNYRMLVVGVGGRGNPGAVRPREVTYDGVALAPARELANGQVYSGIYYLSEDALPDAAGTYELVVGAASPQNTFGLVADILELRGVERTSGVGPTGVTTGSSCMGAVVTPLAVTPGAFIYGLLALDGTATPAALATSMQTVTQQTTASGNPGVAAGYYGPIAAAGNRNFSWADPSPSCSWVQTAIVLKPAQTL